MDNILRNKNKISKGFTIIELLVVISIIGLLAGIILTTFTGVRKLARDSRRIADLRQFNSAIQFYINDNGHAPYAGASNCQASNAGDGSCYTITPQPNPPEWAALQSELTPYLQKLPVDPCGASCNVGNRWAMLAYKPPASMAYWCDNPGPCTYTEAQLNSEYSVFAQVMEVGKPEYTSVFGGVPTFGFKTHAFGTSF